MQQPGSTVLLRTVASSERINSFLLFPVFKSTLFNTAFNCRSSDSSVLDSVGIDPRDGILWRHI